MWRATGWPITRSINLRKNRRCHFAVAERHHVSEPHNTELAACAAKMASRASAWLKQLTRLSRQRRCHVPPTTTSTAAAAAAAAAAGGRVGPDSIIYELSLQTLSFVHLTLPSDHTQTSSTHGFRQPSETPWNIQRGKAATSMPMKRKNSLYRRHRPDGPTPETPRDVEAVTMYNSAWNAISWEMTSHRKCLDTDDGHSGPHKSWLWIELSVCHPLLQFWPVYASNSKKKQETCKAQNWMMVGWPIWVCWVS